MAIVDDIFINQLEIEYVFIMVGGFFFGSNVNVNVLCSFSIIILKFNIDVEVFIEWVMVELEVLNLVDICLWMVLGQLWGLILSNFFLCNVDVDVVLQGNDVDVLDEVGWVVLVELGEKVILVCFCFDVDFC